jgi:iron(III) transport system substrate-binding protein
MDKYLIFINNLIKGKVIFMKKLLTLFLSIMMVLSLVGCGANDGGETNVSNNGNSDNKTEEVKERPYYVKGVDEVTGTITVYTTMEETQQEALKEIWNNYYPNCKIEIQADSVGTLATRIRGDESSDVDVVIGGMFAADGDTYHDILQSYTSVCDEEQLYHDESGYYTFYDVQVMCLVVNTQLRDELGIEIKGYEDLLNPALEGKVILAAPDASSSGWRQVQTMLSVMGDEFDDEKGWSYIKSLMPMAFSSTSSKDVYNLVINGEYVVGLSYESTVAALIKDGAPVECIYMEEGNTAMAGGAAIVKDAPNLTAAQAMMDILASTEFQDVRALESSGRGSNSNCNLLDLPSEDTLNIVDLDFKYLSENKANICDKWNTFWAELH